MNGPTLTLRGHTLDTVGLRGDNPLPSLALSENERAALDFCREWLNGEESFLFHTSGSTGEPKPISLLRSQMEASARATAAALGLESGQHALVCLPARFVAGRMMLARVLVCGLHAWLVEPSANPLAALEAATPIDFAAFVPLQVQTLLARPETRARLDAMSAILIGGGPVGAALEDALLSLRARVFHTYGMTETATHVALRRLNGPSRSEAFHPLPGVELRLDERGSLAVCGAVTAGEWVQTNDSALLHADGSFVWLGRVDNVVNSGGVKVHVERLEAQLERLLPALAGDVWGERRFFVAGLPDLRLGARVTLVLEGEPLPQQVERALLDALRAHLGPYETPRAVVAVAAFAETPTGKINRVATLSPDGG